MSTIDPQEFGRLEAEVSGLRRDNDRLIGLLEKLEGRLKNIEDQLAQANGGWKVLMAIGGASSVVGGLATWALTHLTGKGPS